MASTNSINRAAIAALVLCVYSQAVIVEAYAQSVSSGVSSGATPNPVSTPPPPTVPDIAAAVSPEVSAALAHPNQDTQVIDFAQIAGGVLNVPGDFTNLSTLYVVSTNSQVQTATISAGGSIFNSGTITTILPTGGLPGYTNLVANLNLVLNAVNNVVNLGGQITSAGNLTVTAGSAVVNVASPATNSAAIMSAVSNVSVQAASLVNTGLIAATTGNINIASAMSTSLAMNATGGQFQALQGVINIRDASVVEKVNLDILGGDWLSRELNFYSGTGITNLSLRNVSGTLNGSTGELFIRSEGALNLANITVVGDPFVATPQDITISGSLSSSTVDLISQGNIILSDHVASIYAQEFIRLKANGSIIFQNDDVQLAAAGIILDAGEDIDGTNLHLTTDPSQSLNSAFGIFITAHGSINTPGLHLQSKGLQTNVIAYGDLNARTPQ